MKELLHLVAAILCISSHPSSASDCPVDATQPVHVNVVEDVGGDPGSTPIQLVIDFNQQYNGGEQVPLISRAYENNQGIFEQFFEWSGDNSRLNKGWIDREEIATRLMDTYSPVIFKFDLLFYNTDLVTIRCLNITVNVIDLDDNAPTFTPTERTVTFEDDNSEIGNERVLPHPGDHDEGENGTTIYELIDDSGRFGLEFRNYTGTNRVQSLHLRNDLPLDHEERASYQLQLRVSEDNDDPDEAILDITVVVADVCDEPSMFMTSRYTPTVSENAGLHTEVIRVEATDRDDPVECPLQYSITRACGRRTPDATCITTATPNQPFVLDSETGSLTLIGDLDRESIAEYEVNVQATDMQSSATAVIVITVDDINDNCPEIASNIVTQIPEHQEVDSSTAIGLFTVVDTDVGRNGQVIVNLLDNSTGVPLNSQTFRLTTDNNIDYRIFIDRPLDYETQREFRLIINTRDNGTQPCFTDEPVTITITDHNDHPPVFDPIESPTIPEDSVMNTMVVAVTATDQDSGNNAIITFELPESSNDYPHQHLFTIDSGNILVGEYALDYETNRNYTLLVRAWNSESSHLQETLQEVVIYVENVNDSPPEIHVPLIEARENHTVGSPVGQIVATDADNLGGLAFSLGSDSSSLFSISSSNGMLILEDQLDYEDATSHSVTVEVHDGSFTESAVVTINVLPVNDEAPVFINQQYMENVLEEGQPDTLVTTVTATDGDIPSQSLSYVIRQGMHMDRFRINSLGEIYTTQSLDRDNTPRYTLWVQATDGELNSTLAEVTIQVLDINDHPPEFSNTPYNFAIVENTSPNPSVGTVSVIDLDYGVNQEVRFEISSGDPNEWFSILSINEHTGEITANRAFDHETDSSPIQFTVTATDLGEEPLSNITTVTVTITDVNDNEPVFPQDVYHFTVREDFPTGRVFGRVLATDIDGVGNNDTRYSFSDQTDASTFFIKALTGELSLVSSLDYETTNQTTFDVIATDNARGDFQTSTTVVITITNARDLNLTLGDFSPHLSVVENTEANHTITTLRVTDTMNNTVSRLIYTLTTDNNEPSPYFGIRKEDDTAYIYTRTHTIDREAEDLGDDKTYRLILNASDPDTTPDSYGYIVSYITIEVLDINDNTPTFLTMNPVFSIWENGNAGEFVASFEVMDPDAANNGTIHLSINSINSTVPFNVTHIKHNNGQQFAEIRVVTPLDRETVATYEFFLQALDQGNPRGETMMEIRVHVLDINDNEPKFCEEPPVNGNCMFTFSVPENQEIQQVIATVEATDLDDGTNAEIRYEFVPGQLEASKFTIESSTGRIILTQSLDQDAATNEITFDVRAVDGGNKASTATVIISIVDINGHCPVFINSSFSTVIAEDHPSGVPFTSLLAVDQDRAPNNIVRYALADYSLSRIFDVNKDTGGISIEDRISPDYDTIDYERKNEYKVNIIAYDNGSPPRYCNETLTVQISNVNEHTPEFDVSDIQILMSEAAQAGDEVLKIQAYDKDYADSLVYTLTPSNSPFSWNNEQSAIVLSSAENMGPNFILHLSASDGTKHSTINIAILVVNENDHSPVFSTQDTAVMISENTESGSSIFAVHASDADNATSDAVIYSISAGNTDDTFYINPKSGVIYVAKDLDYETETRYELTLQATDTGEPAMTSTPLYITVDITNENDEVPVFEQTEYTFTLVENNDAMASVGCVRADDVDEEGFGITSYSIVDEGEKPGFFSINENSGCITAISSIDRETDREFHLTVQAQDEADSTITETVRVTVEIGDLNDNGPSFSQQNVLFYVSPDYTVNQVLGFVVASDPDSAENALFTYEIVSQNPNIISLAQDGEVSIATEIPTEYELSYSIVVRATSNVEGDERSSDATVEIIVESDSAHHPQFTQQTYEEHVTESANTGHSILDVSGVVSDQDGTSGMTYSFAEEHEQFALDSETGLLTLQAHLNYEDVTRYELRIRAIDATSRTATATLIINVEDGNDHAPVFISPPSELILSPIPYANIQLFSVLADDDDIGDQGTVGYSIVGDTSGTFEIDSQTGVVTNKVELLPTNMHVFVIRAFDHGSPLMSSNITVRIRVDDTSNRPLFSNGESTIEIPVAEDKNSKTDPIIQGFSTTPEAESYHLVYSNASKDMFSIDIDNKLVLNSQLDYETASQYLLIIEARSISNGIRLSSFLMVNIKVTDVNDNEPRFMDLPVQEISELASPLTEVFTVEATDDDSGSNAVITYAITGGSLQAFNIDQTTGVVTLAKTLDRETTPRYNLVIRATDGGEPSKQNETTVIINIVDVNDNPPVFGQANYSISVYEYPHSHIGDSIILIQAEDTDVGSLSYYIELLNGSLAGLPRTVSSDTFSIDFDTGNITLHRKLDREEVDSYFVKVEARDTNEIHTAVAYLTVKVLDVNDHSPEFVNGQNDVVTVYELWPENTMVLERQQVNDRDIGQNSLVKYSLGDGWPEGHFKIHPWTGVLRTAISSFPFDESMEEFVGKIKAVDQGVPPRTAEISVRVRIQDVNNHPPVLDDTHFHFEISVNHSEKEQITAFNYSDESDTSFNTVTMLRIPDYYTVANNMFKMGPQQQTEQQFVMGLKRCLDESDIGEHQFRIEAIQQSIIPLRPQYIQASYAFVAVVVHPTNNHTPEFANAQVDHEVSESTMIGAEIEIDNLFATDADGNSITYKILTNNVPFEISSPTSPIITVTAELDADSPATASYTLTVQASDNGFPVKSSTAMLRITILDTNDIAPVFEKESYTGMVAENSEVGTLVFSVSAVDGDSASLAYSIDYSIDYPTDCDPNCFPFQIEQTGEIVTVSDIDFEQSENYEFRVAVTDNTHTTYVRATISVIGENEYKPTFKVKLFEFRVTDESQSFVGRIEANDQDSGNEGRLLFRFTDAIEEHYDVLTLNETTGEIFLSDLPRIVSSRKRAIEYFGDLVIVTRTVEVQDSGDAPQSDIAEIAVSFDSSYFEDRVEGTSPAPAGQPYEIIIIVVIAVVVVIVMCLSVMFIAYLCRRHKNRKFKVEDAQLNAPSRGGSEMTERYCRHENGTSLDSKTVATTKLQTGNSASGSERSYTGTADDEMDSGNERYPGHSPNLPNKPLQNGSPRVRSTSDLASSVGTDALHSQTNEHPYTKAQLMRIYAANEGLLDDNISHDSVHMFGSEGGGEADGDLDINNLILQKIHDLEDDEESTTIMDDDASTTYSKGRGPVLTGSVGNIDMMPTEDREDPLNYSDTTKGWIPPNGRPIDETIDEITATSSFASQEEPLPRRHGYDLGPYSHSQGASLYNPSATQESFIGIQQPPKFYKDSKMHDYPRRYYPEEHHERHPRERERDRPRYQMSSHRYGSASVLPDYHHHHHQHHHRVPGHRQHYRSQDLVPPYTKYSPYTPGARRPHPNTYMTPTEGTDGTVTPQTALTGDYHYLSSSSTSLTSTNVSGNGNLSQLSRQPQMYH